MLLHRPSMASVDLTHHTIISSFHLVHPVSSFYCVVTFSVDSIPITLLPTCVATINAMTSHIRCYWGSAHRTKFIHCCSPNVCCGCFSFVLLIFWIIVLQSLSLHSYNPISFFIIRRYFLQDGHLMFFMFYLPEVNEEQNLNYIDL